MITHRRKLLLLLTHRLTISVTLIILLCGALWLSQQGLIKNITAPLHDQIDATLRETAITFATVRAVNAIISLVQESAFGFSLGINVSIAAGQVLDPLNDLIERFSELNLICLVALAIQKTLIDLGVMIGLTILVPLSATIGLIALWWTHGPKNLLNTLWYRLTIISLFALLALPLSIVATKAIDTLLLTHQISAANQRIQSISTDLNTAAPLDQTLKPLKEEAPESLWERLKRNGQQAQEQIEQPAKIFQLIEQIQSLDMDSFVEDIIVLCGLYLLRALLLPLLMLWLTYRAGLGVLTLFSWPPKSHQLALNNPP